MIFRVGIFFVRESARWCVQQEDGRSPPAFCLSTTIIPRRLLVLFVAGLIALAVHAGPPNTPPGLVGFSIPAGSAEHGLRQFVRQAGVELLFEVEQVKGRQTNAVEGRFTPRGALEALVAGTGLVVLQDEQTGAMAVRTARRATAPEKTQPQNLPKETDMQPPKTLRRALAALFLTSGAAHLPAQTTPGDPTRATPEETVTLSVFEVTGSQTGRYQSTESTSGGRVRVNVFDYPASVSVITRDLFEDVGALRVLDAARYVSGVIESNIPNGLDRTTIRGFQVDGSTIDGFRRTGSDSNFDPVVVERLEVVKGPSAILAPSGSPGGTINVVSRKPEFSGNFGSVLIEGGAFDSGRAQLDANRVVGVFGAKQNLALRLVASHEDVEGYHHNDHQQTTIMPMVSWRSATGAQLTLQAQYTRWRSQNFLGLPIDPSSGTNTKARILDGVARDLNFAGEDFRRESRYDFRAFLTVPLSDSLSLRLAGRYSNRDVANAQNVVSPQGGRAGGAINPLTGIYEPGRVFGPAPTFTSSPAPTATRIFNRGGQAPFVDDEELFDVQADLVHLFKSDAFSTTTTAGVSTTGNKATNRDTGTLDNPLDIDNPVSSQVKRQALRTNNTSNTTTQQAYVAESVDLWQGRINLSGNVSYNNFDITQRDRIPNAPQPQLIAQVDTTLVNWGVVVKPIPSVALYYSENENAEPASAFDISRNFNPLREGDSNEYGIRYNGFNGRVFLTVARFNTDQTGFTVPNPANLVVPAPNPPFPALVSDRKAKGWEYEARLNLTEEFSLIGNYTDFTNRNAQGQRFRAVAEHSWAALAHYEFKKDSALRGFDVSVGADYIDRRAGDEQLGLTAASTPTNPILLQNTFFLPSRTLVNLMLGYAPSKQWRAQINVDNVFNKDYLAASLNRNLVFTGDPTNVRATLTYKF